MQFADNLFVEGNITATGNISQGGDVIVTPVTVAAAGATQGTATAIPTGASLVVITATQSSEGVKLPTATAGLTIDLVAPTTKGVKVYSGAAGTVINAATTATVAYAMGTNAALEFYAVSTTLWRVSPTPLANTTIAGSATLQNGLTVTGPSKLALTTVAAAGTVLGNATAIPAASVLVNVTVTTSTEGVSLPTVATGRQITLLTPTTKGYKVYAAAAGQVINAATTATTAYAMTTNHPATFYGVDTAHWRVMRGN